MAESVNFTVRQGDTFDRTVTWEIGPDENTLTPVNLTGYTAAMQIRATYASPSNVVSLTQASGLTLGGSAGTIQIVISATATAALDPGRYVYDLELVSAGGVVTRVLEGAIVFTAEVTR